MGGNPAPLASRVTASSCARTTARSSSCFAFPPSRTLALARSVSLYPLVLMTLKRSLCMRRGVSLLAAAFAKLAK